ncbi:hypothetical protein WR25_08339 [Diploscapter pachys]|uniref:Major facilitator superfamily (MFS) profile domain-containing protein n=1 Tax=Diploscapter pachys TaxID=2018661 RepID=A0A2A2JTV3_9BILA|nr:hypothetical protein WR25_08339 [Diploscapter pachys]
MTLHVTLSLWPMLYYSTEFLTRANISNETAELMSNVMLFVSSFSTLLGMFIVESLPRRFLLLSTAVVNVSSVLFFSLFAHFQYLWDPLKYGCIIALIIWGMSYSIALGPIAWFLTAELVPLDVRAAAVSLSLCINQLTALIFCFVTLPLYSAFGALVLIPLFVLPPVAIIVILFLQLPETRNREIVDIIRDLTSGAKRNTIKMSVLEKESHARDNN